MLHAAMLCLSLNVYYEARGENLAGQFAVAQVTMNRAKEPEQVCNTVFAKRQFSWVESKTEKVKLKFNTVHFKFKKDQQPKDEKAWNSAVYVARKIMAKHYVYDITKGATLYHANYVKPYWSKSEKYRVVARIGTHIFYREINKS